MPELVVRELDQDIIDALKRSATANRRSAEAEHREILRRHLLGPKPKKRSLVQILAAMPYFNDADAFDVR